VGEEKPKSSLVRLCSGGKHRVRRLAGIGSLAPLSRERERTERPFSSTAAKILAIEEAKIDSESKGKSRGAQNTWWTLRGRTRETEEREKVSVPDRERDEAHDSLPHGTIRRRARAQRGDHGSSPRDTFKPAEEPDFVL
jgi:hypothetical protein